MKFFEGMRPEVYLHLAKLRRDKKTGKRLWGITSIVTMSEDLARSCCGQIGAAYEYLMNLENAAAESWLNVQIESCAIDFYKIVDDAEPALHIASADLDGYRLTREAKIVELWFHFELENDDALHKWIKEFAYTRVWAQFKPRADLASVTVTVSSSE